MRVIRSGPFARRNLFRDSRNLSSSRGSPVLCAARTQLVNLGSTPALGTITSFLLTSTIASH